MNHSSRTAASHWAVSITLATMWACSAETTPAPSGPEDSLVIVDVASDGQSEDSATKTDVVIGSDAGSDGADGADAAGSDAGAVTDGGLVDATAPDATAPDAIGPDAIGPDATTPDATAPDTTAPDTTAPDTIAPDTAPPPPVQCGFQPYFTAPALDELYAVGDSVKLVVEAQPPASLAGVALTIEWRANGVVVGTSPLTAGKSELVTQQLLQGPLQLEAQVLTPQGPCAEVAKHGVTMCANKIEETFDSKPTGAVWKTYGDAYWDKGGWLEMTGNEKSKQGAFYDVLHNVAPGDASVRFRIATGGGINSGADGYALNFVEAPKISELESIIKAAGKGGCLGYGVSGDCGNMKILGFHVEFDTWQNKKDPNQDPSSSNHIGVMLNGDATDHKLHVPLNNLEDLKWHDVRVDVVGTKVKVYWDGKVKLEKVVPDLDFRGGRIFVSGSTAGPPTSIASMTS